VSRGTAIQVVGSRENHGATEWHRIATEVAKLEVYQRQVHSEDFKESTNNMEDATQSEKNGKKSGRKKQAEPKMREVRKQAVAVMCPKVTGIAKKLTEMAEQGNCQAAKLVFEFLGIFPPPQAEDESDDTLARYLLRQLGIPDHPSEEEITKVLNGGSEANTGAVESS
jgi:hypothetical protein